MKEGDFVDFELKDQDKEVVKLSDFNSNWIVIYFYPKDDTPGCTIEAIDFTNLKDDFAKLDATVLGISKDSCESHKNFESKQKLTIRLLSDPDSEVQKKFGVWRLKSFMGKESMGTLRSTFLLDKNKKVVKVWESVNPLGHAKEVLETIGSLGSQNGQK